ncbi:MAG: aminomethyl-transferring glycine dehydrogenase [Candidatus Endonucleobacter bathymodioli]|uniref:Glycine dehydrogenase (decarboxylating) n=1 Tax=Candidatus Endonucleibacter bathymodioli TaxID=539814 RepID=A0AA90NJR5_9GAMM|nr:aminomethyl-transferring glycine dehydrogenase [Candidatus Endonucleobacter bathymodioli]
MAVTPPLQALMDSDKFTQRHIGPTESQQLNMLKDQGLQTLHDMVNQAVPAAIKSNKLNIDDGLTESQALSFLRTLSKKNKIHKSYIGMGYYNTETPSVILRNVMENPGWYTAYTPYQSEISQGRLEALLNFQQLTMDLTGMKIANASLLDEATAAAEAMTMCRRSRHNESKNFLVADDVHPQTLEVIRTRAEYLDIDVQIVKPDANLDKLNAFGILLQYPSTHGDIKNIKDIISKAKTKKIMVSVATDLLALMLLKSPGEMNADIVLGSSQRFGIPIGFGGPHAAFFACTDNLKRFIPGRVIGVSIDSRGNNALRMAMQTREQHIRREKATSNICTSQALLANLASFYAVYHGPHGLKIIAERVHRLTAILQKSLIKAGFQCNETYFDTITIKVGSQQQSIYRRALKHSCNLRLVENDSLGVSLDEITTPNHVIELFDIFTDKGKSLDLDFFDRNITAGEATGILPSHRRSDAVLTHPIFNSYHSETDMMRYIKRLENKDYSLVHGMIPLGSCTMKLNAATEMLPLSWPEFAQIHPFSPRDQVQGYLDMIEQLLLALQEITGYDKVSVQPNSGASGEHAGLLAIRKYQASINEKHRHICLIPSSAHGTNPASAVMAGMTPIVVECDKAGNVDIDDLRKKAEQHRANLSALMITYPSTHGIYEQEIKTICDVIHQYGGQVYMDGANMNAMVGISRPADIGSDVSHLNLHKTFAIPHGGGGPGVGPIGVKKHLAPFLPNHGTSPVYEKNDTGAVSAAPFGSASILTITWMYIHMMGGKGLTTATEVAILNANYLTNRLADYYPVLYRGQHNKVAHECILDIRPIKKTSGISETDIAKRLMDYGFHAPTMSFPVAGTLMIEPTESESKIEIDRFIEAMIAIRKEIEKVEKGEWPVDNNPLVLAPHTMADLADTEWTRPYSREEAAFPSESCRLNKYWPTTNRIDNVYGDRNLMISSP